MKKALMIAAIFVGVGSIIGIGLLLDSLAGQPRTTVAVPDTMATSSAVVTSTVKTTSTSSVSSGQPDSTTPVTSKTTPPATSVNTTAPASTTSATTPAGNVTFEFTVIDVSGSGFTRLITGQMTNRGNIDAHNVQAEIEVFSSGTRVNINGQRSLKIYVGSIKAGESVTKQVEFSVGLLDGFRIMQQGANLKATISSDEHTEVITYDYLP